MSSGEENSNSDQEEVEGEEEEKSSDSKENSRELEEDNESKNNDNPSENEEDNEEENDNEAENEEDNEAKDLEVNEDEENEEEAFDIENNGKAVENTDSDDLEEKKVSKTKGKPKSKSKPKTKEKKKSKSKDLSKKSKFEKKDKNHSKEQTNKKNTPNTKTDANAIFPKKSMEIEKIRAPQPSLFTISRDVEEISTNVNSFIDSLNTSWRFSNRTFERTVRIPRKSAFLDETQNYSRSKSPIFQEKQTDTNELEVYRKMFEKKKIPIYYEKEIDTNGLNTQNERKKAKMNDSFQQTDLIDSSPMFNRNFNNNQPNIGHSIKDLYKPKSKYVYDEKEFEENNKVQKKFENNNTFNSKYERGDNESSKVSFHKFRKEDEEAIDNAKKILMKNK